MKTILTKNESEIFIVSDEDYDFIIQWEWSISIRGYVRRTRHYSNEQETVFLHKVIAERIGLDCSNEIDHIDRNKLNNQRTNLRSATASQNSINIGVKSNNKSGYKGVSFIRRDNKYKAKICINKTTIHLGYFQTDVEAAKAYDTAARKYHGEFAYTNFKPQE